MLRNMKTAYAYLRVSGKGQVEGDGFERQLLAIKKYAAQQDIKIVKVFREEGVSGTTDWENRESFAEMMALLLANGTRTVLVEKLDRLARDLMIQESIVADFRNKHLTLVSVAEPDLCSDDPSRVVMRQVMGAFHQYEKSMLVAKLKGARQRKRASGERCEGQSRYGERDGEQKIIDRVRELHKDGLPLMEIARKLDAEGFKTRKEGGKWHPNQVSRILARS